MVKWYIFQVFFFSSLHAFFILWGLSPSPKCFLKKTFQQHSPMWIHKIEGKKIPLWSCQKNKWKQSLMWPMNLTIDWAENYILGALSRRQPSLLGWDVSRTDRNSQIKFVLNEVGWLLWFWLLENKWISEHWGGNQIWNTDRSFTVSSLWLLLLTVRGIHKA